MSSHMRSSYHQTLTTKIKIKGALLQVIRPGLREIGKREIVPAEVTASVSATIS